MNSFEDVLHLTGNTDCRYLSKSIPEIRRDIQEYEPDSVYLEFNISAIIAAKLGNTLLSLGETDNIVQALRG